MDHSEIHLVVLSLLTTTLLDLPEDIREPVSEISTDILYLKVIYMSCREFYLSDVRGDVFRLSHFSGVTFHIMLCIPAPVYFVDENRTFK